MHVIENVSLDLKKIMLYYFPVGQCDLDNFFKDEEDTLNDISFVLQTDADYIVEGTCV